MTAIHPSDFTFACCTAAIVLATFVSVEPCFGQEKTEVMDEAAEEAEAEAEEAEEEELRESMLGAWVQAGKPGSMDDPEPGARMKFWGLGHWMITQTDPETGELLVHHGGTYTLEGDKYVETIKFAAASTQSMVGNTYEFKIEIHDDEYTQVGVGNPFDERWLRLREGDGEEEDDRRGDESGSDE